MQHDHALVVMSGGQDSGTCLLWALANFGHVEAVSFDYGQRHVVELNCARELCERHEVKHRVFDLSALGEMNAGYSAMVDADVELTVEGGHKNLPTSFVPGRNIILLSLAASYAIARRIRHIVTGVCQTDYSGYPDCRRTTIDVLEETLRLGNDLPADELRIQTPLMFLTKAQTWEVVHNVAGLAGIKEIREHTHTCYTGDRTEHNWGRGCGECPACELRKRGHEQWAKGQWEPFNIPEPT